MRTSQLLALTVALATSTMANPVPARDASSDCTITIPEFPHFTGGPTWKVWTTTTASTKYMDCGSCTAVAMFPVPMGPGPVVFFTETRTMAEPWITTVLACAAPTAAPENAVVKGPEITPAP